MKYDFASALARYLEEHPLVPTDPKDIEAIANSSALIKKQLNQRIFEEIIKIPPSKRMALNKITIFFYRLFDSGDDFYDKESLKINIQLALVHDLISFGVVESYQEETVYGQYTEDNVFLMLKIYPHRFFKYYESEIDSTIRFDEGAGRLLFGFKSIKIESESIEAAICKKVFDVKVGEKISEEQIISLYSLNFQSKRNIKDGVRRLNVKILKDFNKSTVLEYKNGFVIRRF